ncbi:MAG: DUF3349 domain-containing protein [Gordonia sp. (in: high G+C Gram-positive bacteria)]
MADRPQFLKRIVDWLRAGYPNGVPDHDFNPLLALLRRQLTEDEVTQVTHDLIRESPRPPEPISKIDAGVKITEVTQELPHEADIAHVRKHLEALGWPFDDNPLAPPATTPDNLPGSDPAGGDTYDEGDR